MAGERTELKLLTVEEGVEGKRQRSQGWFCRNKTTCIFLAAFAIVAGCLVFYGIHTIKVNSDLVHSISSKLASDNQQTSNFGSGFSVIGVGEPEGNTQKHFINIGMRQDYKLQECQDPYYKLSFPDIDYALMGYNILRGYPLATGHDPGFTFPIFIADYENAKQTADCRYSVPKGLVVVPDISCVTSFSSQIVQTKYEFAKSLSVSASVSGGGWGVSFSASAGYKESSSQIATGESVYILSSATCNYYFSKLIQRSAPPFDPDFLNWIERLNNTNLKDTYFEFFDTYGTHFATEVTFGARFTYEHKMSSKQYETKSEKGVNVAAQASYSGLFSVGGGFNMDSSQKEEASNFSKSVETKTITVGAAPPANGDAMTWASTVKDSPVPSKYKLSSIEELFTEKFMNPVKMNVKLETINQNVKAYKYDYCKYLMSKGEVVSCKSLTPGLELVKTRLADHYDEIALTYTECIDHCLKQINCVAITYCDGCESSSGSYRTCYKYTTGKEISTNSEDLEKWKTVIFIGKMKAPLELGNVEVIGTERGFENEEDKNADKTRCSELCVDDAYCVVYSFCTREDETQKCKLFSSENVRGFNTKAETKSVFVSKHDN